MFPSDDNRPLGLRLRRLWAPYRLGYVVRRVSADRSDTPRDPFVVAPTLSDEEGLIVARGKHVYCLLNLYPYTPGHAMVVPYRKIAHLEALNGAELAEIMDFAKRAHQAIEESLSPSHIFVGFNLGKAAGGSVGDHLHLHLVPETATATTAATAQPEALETMRRTLAGAWPSKEDTGVGKRLFPTTANVNHEVDSVNESDGDMTIAATSRHVVLLAPEPYNAGHLLIRPKRLVKNLGELELDEGLEMLRLAQHAIAVLRHVSSPEGFNVGFGSGIHPAGSPGLAVHVVPRWPGDANFMTILNGTKVLPQAPADTHAAIASAWSSHGSHDGDAGDADLDSEGLRC